MKGNGLSRLVLLATIVVFLASCKTEFEKIRTSTDPAVILTKAHEYYKKEDFLKAHTLYEIIIPSYRGRLEAEDIYYNYAYCHYYEKQYLLAAHYFKNFSNTFINSPRKEEADFMAAYSNYKLSPKPKLDQSYSLKAIEALQLFVNTYPNSSRLEQCNQLIDEIRGKLEVKAFEEGKLYYDMHHYNSATQSFENMLKDFPETKMASEVGYLVVKSTHELAKNSVYEKKEERLLITIAKCKEYTKRFKDSEYRPLVQEILYDAESELTKHKNNG